MKKNLLRRLLLLLIGSCFLGGPSIAQKTNSSDIRPEDVSKIIEQQKREIESDQDMDPELKARLMKMLNSKTIKETTKKMDHLDSKMKAAFKFDEKMSSLPMPDKKRLASIPTKTFTKVQLAQYVSALSTKLNATIDADARANANKIIARANGNIHTLNAAAIGAWYNGASEEALLLSVKSASLSANPNILNNLSAMLNMIGHEEKAVPLLQYALAHDPVSAAALNNLGRAWLGLGEKKKAKQMFINCVRYEPAHPEANNSLGCLYEAEGDKAHAQAAFEKSLEGGFNENAYEHLSKLDPEFDIVIPMQHHYKAPAYFNQFKIELPDECHRVEDKRMVEKKVRLFMEEMDRLTMVYSGLMEPEWQKNDEQLKASRNSIMENISEGKIVKVTTHPLFQIAALMVGALQKNFMQDTMLANKDYREKINSLFDEYRQKIKQTTANFESQYRFGDGGELGRNACLNCEQVRRQMCEALHQLANEYQSNAAEINLVYRKRYKKLLLNYFDESVYWRQLSALTHHGSDANFYETVIDYLIGMKNLAYTTPLLDDACKNPDFSEVDVSIDKYEANAKPQCPVSIVIAFGVGKLNLDCTSFGISGGELIKAGYKHDFTSGQSTLSAGAGVSVNVGVGAVNAGAEASETIYLTFDGNGNLMDAGLKTGAGASAQAGVLNTSIDADITLSMNSGFNFTRNGFSNSINL